MNLKFKNFITKFSIKGNEIDLFFILQSGNIDFPRYKVYTYDGKYDFIIRLDPDSVGNFKIESIINMPVLKPTENKNLIQNINNIFDKKRKNGEFPPYSY